MNKATSGDFELPEFDATCSGGVCGPIDYDFIFDRNQRLAEEKIDNEAQFHKLVEKAAENIHKGNFGMGLYLYKEAYELAWETDGLGIDGCFGVMFHVQYFNFHEDALRMCQEITEKAFQTKDISILRDLWTLLPEVGNGSEVHEKALILRDDIAVRHPEVMDYRTKFDRRR